MNVIQLNVPELTRVQKALGTSGPGLKAEVLCSGRGILSLIKRYSVNSLTELWFLFVYYTINTMQGR